jgi:type II secretory pathway component GspD/PulD (secretin)
MNVKRVSLSFLSAVSIVSLSVACTEVVIPNFQQTDVRKLVEVVGQITGSEVVIDEGVQGVVTFQSDAPMTPAELRSGVIAHLSALGYEVTDRDGVLRIGPRKL